MSAMLDGGHQFEEHAELAFLRPDGARGQFAFNGGESGIFADVIPDKMASRATAAWVR